MKKRVYKMTGMVILVAIIIAGCAKGASTTDTGGMKQDNSKHQSESDITANDKTMKNQTDPAEQSNGAADKEVADENEEFDSGEETDKGDKIKVTETSRKLVITKNITAETKKFDALKEALEAEIKKNGGYIEEAEIDGTSYTSNAKRDAYYTIRIPEERLETFLGGIKGKMNVTNLTESVEDITLNYVDSKSHVAALRVEQETLTNMLKEAKTVDQIIKIQDRLKDIRYELEEYESQIRLYDNEVAYATVNFSIEEVEKETSTKPVSFWRESGDHFINSLGNIGKGIQSILILFIGGIPYLLIVGIIGGIAFLYYRKKHKKQRSQDSSLNHEIQS